MSIVALKRAIVRNNNKPAALAAEVGSELGFLGVLLARGERVARHDLAYSALCGDTASMSDDQRDKLAKVLAAPMLAPKKNGKKTAIVTFLGLVTYDVEYQPYAVSTRNFTGIMRALAKDDSIDEVVLMMDSPGGTVFGLPEAADAVWNLRQKKAVHAVVDIMAASAGYYVASQATSISAMPSGAGVGSIGVRMMHVDCSQAMANDGVRVEHIYSGEYKVEGNMFEPLSDETRAYYQSQCDELYLEFLAAVARGRETTVEDVRENFGKGRVMSPADAKRLGMIDKLAEPGDAIAKLGLMTVAAATESVAIEAKQPDAPEAAEVPENTAPEAEPEVVADEVNSKEEVNEGLTTETNDIPEDQPDASAELDVMRAELDLMGY